MKLLLRPTIEEMRLGKSQGYIRKSVTEVPDWLEKHRQSIRGELMFMQCGAGRHEVVLINDTSIVHRDTTLPECGVQECHNSIVTFWKGTKLDYKHDGRVETINVTEFIVIVNDIRYVESREDDHTRHFPVGQQSYVLLHDGTDSLLIYAGTTIPTERVKQGTLQIS